MSRANNTEGLPLIVGISGASGIQYGVRTLEILKSLAIDSHLILTKSSERVRSCETALTHKALVKLATAYYKPDDIGCLAASGSFIHRGMIIAPCSMKTLASIALGLTDNALTRAAEVTLKERRRLVLLVRETPLTAVHLKHMQTVTEMGAIVAPPVPAFYQNPQCIDDIVNHTVVRALDLFDIHLNLTKRWQGLSSKINEY